MPRALLTTSILLSVALVATSCGLFDSDDAGPVFLERGDEVDIAYGPPVECPDPEVPCGSRTLDIYRSSEPGPNPVLVWLHGGGFVLGDKTGLSADLQALLDDGWDIVSVGYPLAQPDGTFAFPTAVQDAKLAVRWVKANAEEQDWDPDTVAAMGHSAGGNLAGMLATTAGDPELEPDMPAGFEALAEVDSSIVAAVAINPVSDIQRFADVDEGSLDVVSTYLNCDQACEPLVRAASVHTHVDADSAPMLALHGVDDELAEPAQGQLVAIAYDAAGVSDRFELVVVDDGPEEDRGHNPNLGRFVDRFVEFLDAQRS